MEDRFRAYIAKHSLFAEEDRILLAVSGGIDSVVMMELFYRCGFKAGVAHCNFNLRGEESDVDEYFVRNLASIHHFPFYSIRFNTEEYAEIHGISIQMAARELRYEWFEEIRHRNGFDYIALAHNRNDQVETFLLNLTRGTGIRGLTGIKPKSGRLLRPLLFAGRKEIQSFAVTHRIHHREDSSNQATYYSRNRLRHLIIPEFTEMNPRFEESVEETIERLREAEQIYQADVDAVKKELLVKDGDCWTIPIKELSRLRPLRTYLFELLTGFNFSLQQIDDILDSLEKYPGKRFFSPTHRLVRDRDYLLINEQADSDAGQVFYVEENCPEINEPLHLTFRTYALELPADIPANPLTASLDADQVMFPLIIRRWRQGDYFQPFGMESMKKLSDFFVDNKFSLPEKENTWILASGDKIMWIIGKRIDHRFRITPHTRRVLEIRCILP